jgi:hypothetical protein
MKHEGPPLATLLRRLLDTPPDFLAEPRIGKTGVVHVDAVAGDVAARLSATVPRHALERFTGDADNHRNRLALALLGAWVYADDAFRAVRVTPAALLDALDDTARELAPYASASHFHGDAERREELARTLLARLELRPAGENEAQAQDRLANVSAAQRKRVVEAAGGAAARARAIREALARKAAEESADKMWRE